VAQHDGRRENVFHLCPKQVIASTTGQVAPTSAHPRSHLSVDFITWLPPSQGLITILVVIDRFSKAALFIALPKLLSSKETADLADVYRLHRLPQDIISDCGPQFVTRYRKAFCSLLGAPVSLSSGFHPQSNGHTERANQELEKFLRCFVSIQGSNWSKFLVWVEYAHNTLPILLVPLLCPTQTSGKPAPRTGSTGVAIPP
jgi:hypothetical protein